MTPMEKAAEDHCDKIKESYRTYDGTLHDWLQQNHSSFIAGWQEQDKEIERLKALLRVVHKEAIYYGNDDYRDGLISGDALTESLDSDWEKFKKTNNL